MRFVAETYREHPEEFSATFRTKYGVSSISIGDEVPWGEAYDLTIDALKDTNTQLAAVNAGWAYPASMPALLQLAAQVGDQKTFKTISPWGMQKRIDARKASTVTPQEIAAAQAELDAEIIFK